MVTLILSRELETSALHFVPATRPARRMTINTLKSALTFPFLQT